MKPIKPPFVPAGHFYSPLCDPEDLRAKRHLIWPYPPPADSPGVDYNVPAQMALLERFAAYTPEVQFSEEPPDPPGRYYYHNDQFPCLDAEVLFCFLRHLLPPAFIEIGSGFSTLVSAEVNRRYLSRKMHLACVEPHPRQFLIDGIDGVTELVTRPVQSVDFSFFDCLGSNGILFIDSSHVSKTGSDVNHLLFEVIPRRHPGVYIHFHDIFLPDDYPEKWAIEDERHWNEQYLVRAFLQYNSAFEVIWSSYLMATRYPAETARVFTRFPALGAGGSLWIRRKQ
jgi:hypothetical protein